MQSTVRFRSCFVFLLTSFLISAAAHAAVDKNTITLAMTGEPPQLDATKATDSESFFILGHVMEGLTRSDEKNTAIPGVAEKWEINDKGATFHLRKNARWSDGKPVTAKDFIFSWRTALDPKTASEYAFILYPIKNAEAINTKKAALNTLGATAPDDYTIKIEFEKPCGYFLSLTSFATYFPIREDFYNAQKGRYGAEAGTMLYNGPFMLTQWSHGASIKMEKNPNYWNAAKVSLAAIEIPYMLPDDRARFNLFKDKKTDLVNLTKDTLPDALSQKLKLHKFSDGTLFFMEFNFNQGRMTRNLNLRKAIQAVFNPAEYVNQVIAVPGTQPGRALIPSWINGVKGLFRKEYPVKPVKTDLAAARRYMDAALKELGVKKLPPLVWLTGDSPLSSKEAEYFQNLFKTTLGIELRIDKQIFKQRLAKMSQGDFDIVAAGWGPDYADPMTFADLMTSWNENNRGRYSNAKYDELIRKAQATSKQQVRMDAMAAAEKIALEELAILPLYERNVVYAQSPRVDGVIRKAVGMDPDLTFAKVVSK